MHFLDLHHRDDLRPACRYPCLQITGDSSKQPVATLVTSRIQSLLVNAITGEDELRGDLGIQEGSRVVGGRVQKVCVKFLLLREKSDWFGKLSRKVAVAWEKQVYDCES